MSQFSKYLEIVQEGKDYQYNEMNNENSESFFDALKNLKPLFLIPLIPIMMFYAGGVKTDMGSKLETLKREAATLNAIDVINGKQIKDQSETIQDFQVNLSGNEREEFIKKAKEKLLEQEKQFLIKNLPSK